MLLKAAKGRITKYCEVSAMENAVAQEIFRLLTEHKVSVREAAQILKQVMAMFYDHRPV